MAGRGTEDAQRGQGARRECGRGRLEWREGGSDGQRGETEGGRVGTTSDSEKRKAGGRKDTGKKQERESRMDGWMDGWMENAHDKRQWEGRAVRYGG